jgi:hypothetical protein
MSLAKAALALRAAPAADVPGVLAIMAALDGTLDDGDGFAWFNRLYRRVTERVATAIAKESFEDLPFVEMLDVTFANYCFAALRAYIDDASTAPRAWLPLFQCNDRKGLARVQFALAGMNAHINRDLMRAVVDVCARRNIEPHLDSPQKRDFDKLNPLLREVEEQVHAWYLKEDGPVFEEAEAVLSTWSLKEARSNAWLHAEGLWAMPRPSPVTDLYLAGVDKFVGFANRSLLVPLPKRSCLARLLVRARAQRALGAQGGRGPVPPGGTP